jgi:putative peptidoglycan lipid II flippase
MSAGDVTPQGTGRLLFRSSLTVGSMTLISRVAGLVRDVVLATLVGAAANADAFFIAFRIPQFLRRLFAEGAFSQAFVPVLSEYRATRSAGEVKALVDAVSGVLGAALLAVTALAVIGAPVVALVFAPGFSQMPEKLALTGELIRITFPYLFFISMTGFAGAVLNAYSRFSVPAFTPVFLNLTLIAGALIGARYVAEPVFALAWAVFVAGMVQLVFQLPFVARIGMLPRPRLDFGHEGVRRILGLMLPALFGVSVSQINLLLDTVLASFLPTGSVSWLYYAERLSELPLGVFGIAIATVILPGLSREHATESEAGYRHTLDWAITMICMIGLPAGAALLVLAAPILATLFQYGALTARDVSMAGLSLSALALGLPAFMLIKVLASAFYSRQDMRTPVKIGIIAMVANMVLNLLFVLPLHLLWQIGHMGLALATTGAAYLNAGLLLRGLVKRGTYQLESALRADLRRIGLATLAMSAGLLACLPWLADIAAHGWATRGLRLGVVCVAGAALYFGVLLALRPAFLVRGLRRR